MERLIKTYKYLLIILTTILLSACSNIYWGNIINETNDVITVKLTFVNEYGTHFLEMKPIKANENSIWEYEQSSLFTDKIDKNLSTIEATNYAGCTIVFDRKAIEKKVGKNRQVIVIEPQDFIDACSSKSNMN
ncbi:hypothetical protein [Pseudoalteromonas ruthenica]|uniref:hypothetical protein n=1 Tax=Pseudoalteromonas ruthenica TaxID=151081 RepID=UPI0003B5E15C|nr:hypothetical protein [Pseudoalteromonas ruthenica]